MLFKIVSSGSGLSSWGSFVDLSNLNGDVYSSRESGIDVSHDALVDGRFCRLNEVFEKVATFFSNIQTVDFRNGPTSANLNVFSELDNYGARLSFFLMGIPDSPLAYSLCLFLSECFGKERGSFVLESSDFERVDSSPLCLASFKDFVGCLHRENLEATSKTKRSLIAFHFLSRNTHSEFKDQYEFSDSRKGYFEFALRDLDDAGTGWRLYDLFDLLRSLSPLPPPKDRCLDGLDDGA